MSRIKRMFVALIAAMAIGVVGAGAAQAATGTGHIETNLGACDFTYDYTAFAAEGPHAPAYTNYSDLSNFAPDPNGECDASDFNASLHYHYNSSTGAAQATGTISLPGPLFGTCTYSGAINGTGNASSFNIGASPQTFPGGGAFLCPSSVQVLTGTSLTF